jgi:hypothetical protein
VNRKPRDAEPGGFRAPTAGSAGIASLVAVALIGAVDAAWADEAPSGEGSSATVGPCAEQAEEATATTTEAAAQSCPEPEAGPVDEPPPEPGDSAEPQPSETPAPVTPEPVTPEPGPVPPSEADSGTDQATEPAPAASPGQATPASATGRPGQDPARDAAAGARGHEGRGHDADRDGRDRDRDHGEDPDADAPADPLEATDERTGGGAAAAAVPSGLGPVGFPALVTEESPIPPYLIPIYQDCGRRYEVPWRILAAINQVETGFGANLGPSSAGAMGWMQFMPETWRAYGLDASGDGERDPNNPEDAICAAAGYLRASGARTDLRGAIFAYNHADWYVDMVLDLARQYASIDAVDPLPTAQLLDRDFARRLARAAREQGVDWATVLALLRARGETGGTPATVEEVREVAAQLAAAGRRRGGTLTSFFGSRAGATPGLEPDTRVLARYNRAVGLRGLVEGMNAVRDTLAQRVLDSERLSIYAGGRSDVERGAVDVRVLTLLLYLAEKYDEVTVSCLITGHGYYARPGVPSAHVFGRAVDIATIDGTPIVGNQGPGSVTGSAVRQILRLPHEVQPAQVISLLDLGGPSFAAADHDDHIHVGY